MEGIRKFSGFSPERTKWLRIEGTYREIARKWPDMILRGAEKNQWFSEEEQRELDESIRRLA